MCNRLQPLPWSGHGCRFWWIVWPGGGKLAALFGRSAARELFDAHYLLTTIPTNPERLRLAFVLYSAMNRGDWRTINVTDIKHQPQEASRQLFPLLVQLRR